MEENKEDEITDCKREIDILKRNVLELQDQLRNAYIKIKELKEKGF
jgi:predicted  nucleic acid-binding Zn-ribbon protein|tara:strand:+ start:224 stop:361 length:138 start_codon:yes stop_codon:yes gene_type:complete